MYLTYVSDSTRSLLLESSATSTYGGRFARSDTALANAIKQVRRDGHFIQHHSFVQSKQFDGFQNKECLLAVPMLSGDEIVGVLAARMMTRAVKREWIEQQLAPKLKAAAAAIVAAELAERAAPRTGTSVFVAAAKREECPCLTSPQFPWTDQLPDCRRSTDRTRVVLHHGIPGWLAHRALRMPFLARRPGARRDVQRGPRLAADRCLPARRAFERLSRCRALRLRRSRRRDGRNRRRRQADAPATGARTHGAGRRLPSHLQRRALDRAVRPGEAPTRCSASRVA